MRNDSKYLSLREARELFPGRPTIWTIRLWATKGVRGRVLPSVRCGGRRFVTRDGIESFIEGGASVPAQ
jgi:hypothetical protein